MDVKELSKDFAEAWTSIKSLLDQQADEMKTLSEAVGLLIEEKDQQNEVLKKLIDRQF